MSVVLGYFTQAFRAWYTEWQLFLAEQRRGHTSGDLEEERLGKDSIENLWRITRESA